MLKIRTTLLTTNGLGDTTRMLEDAGNVVLMLGFGGCGLDQF
jgi:hypothetical protein